MEPINIICCWWGNWPEQGWGPEYVYRMDSMLRRHVTVPYNFYLLTDQPEKFEDIHVLPLEPSSWLGRLPKVECFNPIYGLTGRIFVLDLDTVIIRNIDHLLTFNVDFAVRAWYGGLKNNIWIPDGDTLSFRAGKYIDRIWRPLAETPKVVEDYTGGRERWWYRSVLEEDEITLWQRHFPNEFVSYKNHCQNGLPPGATLASFHGNPRIHEVDDPWVWKHWK